MIDLNPYLEQYNYDIKLDSKREDILRTSRNAIDDTIVKYFDNNDKKKPTFRGQGSFSMKTTINPKDTNDEYDIDYGVYLNSKDVIPEGKENYKTEWIKPETVHSWIYRAVENQTSQKPENKNKCVRVKYAPSENSYSYHIDLPIYVEHDGKYFLAVKNGNEWIESNPRAIVDWFQDKVKEKGEDYRIIVRFLKSWSKLQSWNCKKPTGLVLTILVANEFSKQNEGIYDLSLLETVENVIKNLDIQLKTAKYELYNPVATSENLFEDYSEAALTEFKEKLQNLCDNLDNAMEASSEEDAFRLLRKCFKDIKEIEYDTSESVSNYARTSAPAVIGNDGRSA